MPRTCRCQRWTGSRRILLSARRRFAGLPGSANPFNRCLDANPKTLRRAPCGKPLGRCGHCKSGIYDRGYGKRQALAVERIRDQ